MVVRFFWKDCHDCNGDALWVEATAIEAGSQVFPRLSAEQIIASRKLAGESGHLAASMMGKPGLTFCFLVSKDLSVIRPCQVHYPVHNMWNAYSPFREMSERTVQSLDELRHIDLPQYAEEHE